MTSHLTGYCGEDWSEAKQDIGEASYQVGGHHMPEWEAHWPRDNWQDNWYSWRAPCVSSCISAGQALREYLWALRRRMPLTLNLQTASLTPAPGCLERQQHCSNLWLKQWCTSAGTSWTITPAERQKAIAHRGLPQGIEAADWHPSPQFPASDLYEQHNISLTSGKADGGGRSYTCLSQRCLFQPITQW